MSLRSQPARSSCRTISALPCVFILVAAISARAQSPDRSVDRADLFGQAPSFGDPLYDPVTGTDSGHAAASPNDPDLGVQAILKRQEHYRAFTVSAAMPIFYTSNVALVRSGEQDDLVYAPALGISYAPHFTKSLYGAFSVGQQQFWYNKFREFDFGSLDVRAGLIGALPQLHNLQLSAQYNYSRLTTSDHIEEEFFASHGLFFNAELPFRIGRAQQATIGVETNVSLAADPEQPRRHDADVYVAYGVNLTRDLTVSAAGRVAVRDYIEGDRTDLSEILALTATYRFTKWLSASATSTLASNQSNQSVFDYEVANVGGAVAVALRF